MKGDVVFEDEWLKFIEQESKPKTKVFSVWSKCSDCELGEVKWYPKWRHYCFFIADCLGEELIFSDRCLLSIGAFVLDLNTRHKKEKGDEKNGKG